MTRRIDDVDADPPPVDGGGFGEDGDPAFAFLVIAVEGAFHGGGAAIQHSGLLQEAIHEGGLAMVDMGDEGDVAKVFQQGVFSYGGNGWMLGFPGGVGIEGIMEKFPKTLIRK